MDLQPTHLGNEWIKLVPLTETDFENLYKTASDPAIWAQHPTKNRYERAIFEVYFSSAIESGAAFKIIDTKTNEIIGSSRYYDIEPNNKSIAVGFTFLATKYWGTNYNKMLKELMCNYAFNFAESIILHVGDNNIRSQKAVEKLGAHKIGTVLRGENPHFVYKIEKTEWLQKNN